MKLGLSSPLEHKTPEEWAENMQKIGCQAVNFPVDYTAPKEVIQAYEQAAKDQGLVIAEVGAWCNPISPDPEIRENARIRCRGQLTGWGPVAVLMFPAQKVLDGMDHTKKI